MRERQLATPAPRLSQQPVHPLQAYALHPRWRTLGVTTDEIKGTTHAQRNRHPYLALIAGDPQILSGSAICHKQHIRVYHSRRDLFVAGDLLR